MCCVVMVYIVTEQYFETNETNINRIKWGNSYKCTNGLTFKLENENTDSKVDLKLNDLQIQAFAFYKPGQYGTGDCYHYVSDLCLMFMGSH